MAIKYKVPIEVDGQVSAEYLDLSTATTHSVNAGEIAWNSIDGTFDIGLLNGVTLQAGQEMHFYGKATEAISNGDAVMFAGVQGDHILIAKADAVTINANPEYFMGVATQDFATNDFGYVTAFGNVRGINTSAYTLGDILYYDSTSATDGLLTPTMPSAPKAKIIVAAVVKVHATQGILAVRPHTMPRLKDIQDINIDTASAGEILQLQSDGVWENKTLSEAGIQPTLTNPVTGTGTTNYVAKFTGTTSLGNSQIFDNGTNVGIGTTSPSYKLDLGVSNGMRLGSLNIVDGGSIISINSSLLRIYSAGGVKLSYFNGTSIVDGFLINSSGNVGIGTTSPTQKLDVNGNIKISNNNSLMFRNAANNADISIIQLTNTNQLNLGTTSSSVPSVIALHTNSTERMKIDASGNIGIGTTSPGARLDVVGLFDALPARILRQASYGEILRIGRNGVTETASINYPADGVFAINTASTERMRIDANGNVGIGTTSPSARLEVNGNMIVGTGNKSIGSWPFFISDSSNLGWKVADSSGAAKFELYVGNAGINQMRLLGGVSIVGFSQNLSLGTSAYLNTINISNTNGNVGIGTTTPSARLDVRAQGALSTNIVFRVRNSTDTQNFLVVNGAGDVYNNGAGGINTNTFFGENVGRNTTGGNNTAIGISALESNTTGYSNTAIGLNALLNNTTGYYNTAIGISALESNTTGGFNTAIGLGALFSNTTGGDNTAIGREAGNLISDGSNNTITNNSIFIGVDTRALADNQTNQIVIGNGAIGLGSNSVVLGNESTVTTALRGNVGIGTTAPSTLLDVNGIITAIGGNSTQWNSKQEALVSGTNIKTLNGNNVLGSGDLSTKGIHTLVKPAVGETTSFLLYGQTIGNVVGQANRLIAVPYIPATTITCSSLYINISTALAGSNARILIYSDDNGKPGTKIYESANLDCSTTGIKTATTTQTFNAGTIYWICSHSSSTQTFSSANPAALIPINVSGISVFTSYYITPTFGSAPTTFGTGTFIQLALPFIGIKI